MNNFFQILQTNFNQILIFLNGKPTWDIKYIIVVIIAHALLTAMLIGLRLTISRCICIKIIVLILVVSYIVVASYALFVYGNFSDFIDFNFNTILFILHILFNIIYPVYTTYKIPLQNKKTLKDIPFKGMNRCFKGK